MFQIVLKNIYGGQEKIIKTEKSLLLKRLIDMKKDIEKTLV